MYSFSTLVTHCLLLFLYFPTNSDNTHSDLDNEITGGRYLDIITNSLSQTLTIEELDRLEELYNNRGIAKGKLQDYRGAIQDYNKAIELNPNYVDAYYYTKFYSF